MPDPLTSADIEDVLGSIRRLVSEEAAAKVKKGGEADKLVLTQAHRVGEPEAPGDGPLRLGEPVAGAAAGPDLAEELADLEARMSERAERWKDDDVLSPPEDIEALEAEAARAGSRAVDEPAAEALEPAPEAEDAAAEAMEQGPTEEDSAAEAEPPERGAAAADEWDQVEEEPSAEADEPEAAEDQAAAETAEPWPAEGDPTPGAEIAETETEAEGIASDAEASAAAGEESPPEAEDFAIAEETPATADEEAREPEGEELMAEQDDASAYDAWEPAGEEGQPGFRGTGGAETVLEEPPIEAALVRLATAPSLPEAPENVGRPDVESLLDEAELRALVAEVLREELKGPLGERITRNVRKLVRREIAQALSSMDID